MKEIKKVWQKPRLLVLTRGKAEEAVLVICKLAEYVGGPAITNCWAVGGGPCSVENRS